MEAKNYWKAISSTFIVEKNILNTIDNKNGGAKGDSHTNFESKISKN
jgi:hypothetical protein